MKKHIPGFIAGVLVTTTLLGTAAASGALTLTVTPVNIKVNNEVFQPKDVNGNDVMVFAYNGTTYAPLRALAEAYGLQVGWDQASGTATVVDPDVVQTVEPDTTANAYADWTAEEEAAYQEFVSMWEISQRPYLISAGITPEIDEDGVLYKDGKITEITLAVVYKGNLSEEDVKDILLSYGKEALIKFSTRIGHGYQKDNCRVQLVFHYNTPELLGVSDAFGWARYPYTCDRDFNLAIDGLRFYD